MKKNSRDARKREGGGLLKKGGWEGGNGPFQQGGKSKGVELKKTQKNEPKKFYPEEGKYGPMRKGN